MWGRKIKKKERKRGRETTIEIWKGEKMFALRKKVKEKRPNVTDNTEKHLVKSREAPCGRNIDTLFQETKLT